MNHPTDTPVFDAAFAILAQDPLPPDAQARLMELEKQVAPDALPYFGDVWEAFHAAGGVPIFED